MEHCKKYLEGNPHAIIIACSIASLTILSICAMVFIYIWFGYPTALLMPLLEYLVLMLFYAFMGVNAMKNPPEYKPNVVAIGAVVSTALMWLAFCLEITALLA